MQSPSVYNASLRINSIFFPPIPLHIANTYARECASSASLGAGRIVKVASNISGSRIAGLFHGSLMSEAQDIPTFSTPYVDLESLSRYPNILSQPIILGFSLPPPYLSSTASTGIVVSVFCQLVSFIRDCQAWDKYITGSTPTENARVRVRDPLITSSFTLIWIHRDFAILKDPGLGVKTGIENCSVHLVRLRAQILSRWAPPSYGYLH